MTKAKGTRERKNGILRPKILALLTKAAENDEICPYVNTIAGQLDVSSDTIKYNLKKMVTDGLIIMGPQISNSRVCIIVSTGKSTAAIAVAKKQPLKIARYYDNLPWPIRTGSDSDFQAHMVALGVRFEDNQRAHNSSIASRPRFYPARHMAVTERNI